MIYVLQTAVAKEIRTTAAATVVDADVQICALAEIIMEIAVLAFLLVSGLLFCSYAAAMVSETIVATTADAVETAADVTAVSGLSYY